MNKPNTLWKVVSILYIIFETISAVVIILGFIGAGALIGAVAGNVEAGVGIAALLSIFGLVSVALGIAAGVIGLKANVNAGKIFAIILVALAVIVLISSVVQGENIASPIIGLIFPILYALGVNKQIKDNGSAE